MEAAMDAITDVSTIENQGEGRYVMQMPDGQEAFLSYHRTDSDGIAIDYSYVPPAFRGRGVAAMLVERAVDDARSKGHRILPRCGYVAAEFRRHDEWQDVLKL